MISPCWKPGMIFNASSQVDNRPVFYFHSPGPEKESSRYTAASGVQDPGWFTFSGTFREYVSGRWVYGWNLTERSFIQPKNQRIPGDIFGVFPVALFAWQG